MYRLKRTVRPRQRVILKRSFKPYGRTIDLDSANQKQLKHLYDMHNKFIEFIPEKVERESAPEKAESKLGKQVKKELKDANKS